MVIIITDIENIFYSIIRISVFYVILEGIFYHVHRLLHDNFRLIKVSLFEKLNMYRYHKKHHELDCRNIEEHQSTMFAVGALNMDWIEFLFTILLMPLCAFLVGLSEYIILFFTIIFTILLCDSHSSNPILNNEKHIIHHKIRKKNFGFGLYIFDKLYNTFQ